MWWKRIPPLKAFPFPCRVIQVIVHRPQYILLAYKSCLGFFIKYSLVQSQISTIYPELSLAFFFSLSAMFLPKIKWLGNRLTNFMQAVFMMWNLICLCLLRYHRMWELGGFLDTVLPTPLFNGRGNWGPVRLNNSSKVVIPNRDKIRIQTNWFSVHKGLSSEFSKLNIIFDCFPLL